MSAPSLEDRVTALERVVARLSERAAGENVESEKDWRLSLGVLAGDEIINEVINEGRKIRELDRQQAHE
jgi:hypothetical protein